MNYVHLLKTYCIKIWCSFTCVSPHLALQLVNGRNVLSTSMKTESAFLMQTTHPFGPPTVSSFVAKISPTSMKMTVSQWKILVCCLNFFTIFYFYFYVSFESGETIPTSKVYLFVDAWYYLVCTFLRLLQTAFQLSQTFIISLKVCC